jgi:hypothetical protein
MKYGKSIFEKIWREWKQMKLIRNFLKREDKGIKIEKLYRRKNEN